jgi:hypothetical protein
LDAESANPGSLTGEPSAVRRFHHPFTLVWSA